MSTHYLQRILARAAERDAALKVPSRPTIIEAMARVALNRNDPTETLRTAASQVGDRDPLRHAVASLAKQLLSGRVWA